MAHENEVFICYETTTGKDLAINLKESLKKMRKSSFLAHEDLIAGELEEEVRYNAIKKCRYFVVIVTRPALVSPEVEKEIILAQKCGKIIITCKHKKIDRDSLSKLPMISPFQHIDFENEGDLAMNVIEEILKIEKLPKRNPERELTLYESSTSIESLDKLAENQFEVRDIIYEKKVTPYIEFELNKGYGCTLYSRVYNNFSERAYYVEAYFGRVTINKLKDILLTYYNTFINYRPNNSAFSIEQSGLNWIGYGANNFVKALQDQSLRYLQIKKKYGDDKYIHHTEEACFIEETADALFYIHADPDSSSNINKLTLSSLSVGFIFNDIPFNTIYNEFFNKIKNVPESLNEFNTGLTQSFPLKTITFKEEGVITTKYKSHEDECDVSGLYGEIPLELKNNEIINRTNKIIVNLRTYHDIKQKRKHSIYGVKIVQIPSGNYILDFTGDWQ